ncbi:UNVERIFIED_CONTAM: Sin3 histone deacetylase corepressor complex component SDS3 [Trichonephila clavipes]
MTICSYLQNFNFRMYQDKLANLKRQLKQLEDGVHPDYVKKLRKLEQNFQKRQLLNDIFKRVEIERIERDYVLERKAAHKEYEDKKVELRENLICDLEEKKRIIETERSSMDLTSDTWEVKTVTTRKLRRRPNEPLPIPEKRRKPVPNILFF